VGLTPRVPHLSRDAAWVKNPPYNFPNYRLIIAKLREDEKTITVLFA